MTKPTGLKVRFELAPKTNMGNSSVKNLDLALDLVAEASEKEDEFLVKLELWCVKRNSRGDYSKYWSVRIYHNHLGYCAFHDSGDFQASCPKTYAAFFSRCVQVLAEFSGLSQTSSTRFQFLMLRLQRNGCLRFAS